MTPEEVITELLKKRIPLRREVYDIGGPNRCNPSGPTIAIIGGTCDDPMADYPGSTVHPVEGNPDDAVRIYEESREEKKTGGD